MPIFEFEDYFEITNDDEDLMIEVSFNKKGDAVIVRNGCWEDAELDKYEINDLIKLLTEMRERME